MNKLLYIGVVLLATAVLAGSAQAKPDRIDKKPDPNTPSISGMYDVSDCTWEASGAAGDVLHIYGSGFGSKAGSVTFGNVQATIYYNNWADSSIYCFVPTGTGKVTLCVTNAAGNTASTA